MPASYAHNIPSLKAREDLRQASDSLSKTFERLSSGLRINRAADDPAGLMVADALRADVKLAGVAIRNANDGISHAALTDSALGEVENLLERMGELAEQSANGVYTNTQRSALDLEFVALGSEIQRIARTTEFNNRTLLSNSSSLSLQVGFDSTADSQITIQNVLSTLDDLGLSTTGNEKLSFSIIGSAAGGETEAAAQTAAQNALDAITSAINSVDTKRGIVGAAENRLSHAVSYLAVVRENFAAAESRIRDADVAEEVARMVRLQVIQQAATAIVAQANQEPAVALSLLA